MAETTVTANGIRLWYETFGSASDPPVLLIMGLGAQAISWDETFCRRLADGGRYVIRYDNRDVGLSQWFDDDSTPYTLNEMADDAVGLLDALGITRAHVVGVSMGGMIAQVVAITHPERVLTLTSIMSTTGAGDVEPPTPEALAVLTALPGETFEERLDQAMRTRRLLHGPRFDWDEKWQRERATASIERAFHPQGTQRQMQAILQSPPRVRHLDRPVAPRRRGSPRGRSQQRGRALPIDLARRTNRPHRRLRQGHGHRQRRVRGGAALALSDHGLGDQRADVR